MDGPTGVDLAGVSLVNQETAAEVRSVVRDTAARWMPEASAALIHTLELLSPFEETSSRRPDMPSGRPDMASG